MVSTRGGARTGVDDQAEPELKLRKKPVRKAATTTKLKTAKAASAAKTTRSKKTEPEPENEAEDEDEEVDELQGEDVPAVSKVLRKGRAKKDDAGTTSKPTAASRSRATTTTASSRAAATRTTKPSTGKPSKVETITETPDLPPPAQPKAKATRATRATASTRATAAKEKAPPLSPKKITQVSKAPARSAKSATAKATTAKGDGQTAVKPGRPTTRKRMVSDENAGVPEFRPSTAERQGGDEVKSKQSSKAKPAVNKPAEQSVLELETMKNDNDTPMSTRPATPADSPLLEADESEEHFSEQEDTGAEIGVSGDELCGPKTPMKRLSPRERTRYASAQKDTRSEDVSMKTPARRFLVLGSQGGTPQTQKPYRQPRVPMSEVRPTTVARARDRAMVFPQLQRLTPSRELEESEETADDTSTSVLVGGEVIPMAVDHSEIARRSSRVSGEDAEMHALIEAEYASNIKESGDVTNDDAEAHSPSNVDFKGRATVAIPFEMKALSAPDADDDKEAQENLTQANDPNETILVEDHDMEDSLDSHTDASLESDQSVVVRRDMVAEVDESITVDVSMEDIHLPTTTPETIMWENLREDVTIPFNFDSELASSREIASAELDEPVGITSNNDVTAPDSSERQASAVDGQSMPDVDMNMNMGMADTQYQRQSFGDVRLSIDATVNLSDFLDVSSLAEHSGQADGSRKKLDKEDVDAAAALAHQPSAIEIDIPSIPSRETVPELPTAPQHEPQHLQESATPHYAIPTIAFRRKSLPAIIYHTPMRNGARPQTSDGASIARNANPFINLSTAQDKSQHEMTPFRRRLSMAQGFESMSRPRTPSAHSPARSPARRTPRTSGRTSTNPTPRASRTPRTSSGLRARPTPKERFPGLPSRQTYEELAGTPPAKTSMQSMPSAAKSSMKERFPALPPAEKYEDLTKTPSTPQAEDSSTPSVEGDFTTSQQEERYPGLPHRRTYEEHAKTAMPPSRFRTPSQSPVKRPATVQRPASLRKVALRAATPRGSHTPVKTPLRASAMTPGQVPLTPHPGAPLRGVNAYVDVFLNDGSSANSTYIAVLHSLGAKTTKTFNDRVTHVVFKEGSPATLQRLRLHNKQVSDSVRGKTIFCVNGRWVNDSNSEGARMDENDEAYTVDVEDQRATKRRRKSMEPTSLLNIGGNVVRDTNRKSSLGRSSLGRALKADSPSLESPSVDLAEKENSGDSSFGESPATPAYLSAPDSLVQQTAPMNRVRKLDFDAKEQAKNRRLTVWDGGEF